MKKTKEEGNEEVEWPIERKKGHNEENTNRTNTSEDKTTDSN
jgi:hypothetical protein